MGEDRKPLLEVLHIIYFSDSVFKLIYRSVTFQNNFPKNLGRSCKWKNT